MHVMIGLTKGIKVNRWKIEFLDQIFKGIELANLPHIQYHFGILNSTEFDS